jgi:hypothetical protein
MLGRFPSLSLRNRHVSEIQAYSTDSEIRACVISILAGVQSVIWTGDGPPSHAVGLMQKVAGIACRACTELMRPCGASQAFERGPGQLVVAGLRPCRHLAGSSAGTRA